MQEGPGTVIEESAGMGLCCHGQVIVDSHWCKEHCHHLLRQVLDQLRWKLVLLSLLVAWEGSAHIYQLTIIMVMLHITIDDHWICYTRGYGVGSTVFGRGVNNVIQVKISQKLLNYDVVRGQRGALRVWITGECSILGCKGHHVGLRIDWFFYVAHRRKMY